MLWDAAQSVNYLRGIRSWAAASTRSEGLDQHLATVWEAISDALPDEIALQHGDDVTSWREFDQRAGRFASAMLAAGVRPGETVAIDLFNCSEYLEVFFAALKIRAVPANVNYRYLDEELRLLLEQLDAVVLVYSAPLRQQVAGAVAAGPGLRLTVEVRAQDPAPAGVQNYDDLLASHPPAARVPRSPEDSFLSCTGGTTGLPKAVEYVIGRSVANTRVLGRQMLGLPDVDWDGPAVDRALELHRRGLSPVALPASPLMHSTGLIMASLPVLSAGGRVVTLTSRRFDAGRALRHGGAHPTAHRVHRRRCLRPAHAQGPRSARRAGPSATTPAAWSRSPPPGWRGAPRSSRPCSSTSLR